MATKGDLADEWKIASTKKMTSYAFGYVIINYFLYYGLANLFYFYEVEIGIPVIYIAIAFVIFAIWNMVNDPLLGYLTDRPMSWTKKWGLRAPWVVLASIPILVLYVLLWMPPKVNPTSGALIIFVYFIVITCFFDLFFSIYNDHVYGGFTNQFPTEYERRRAFAISTLFMGVVLTSIGIIMPAAIIEYGKPQTFVTVAIIAVIILGLFNIILFLGLRESKEMKEMFIRGYESSEKQGFFKVMKTSLKRRNFVLSIAGYTVSVSAMFLWNSSMIYVFKDVYQIKYSYYMIAAVFGLLAFTLFIPFWSNYAKKHGFKKTYYTCFFLHGLAFIPFLFVPIPPDASILVLMIQVCIFTFIMYFFFCGEVMMLMPVASDTCDEVSLDLGRRQDGTLQGIRTFFFRIAFIIAPVVMTVIHIMTAYNTDPAATQSAIAIWGIRVHTALIPAILYMVMALIFYKFYTLEGPLKADVVKQLKEKGLVR